MSYQVNHAELLDKATNNSEVEDCWMAVQKVIQLHTPEGNISPQQCSHDKKFYPCPTIQAIEKELR
jgi:hypothetical protein